MAVQQVILVNEQDEETGVMEKMEAHEKGILHRAFSIFIFNSDGEMLLQKRALEKYHSGGLWTNARCSHPNPGESTEAAAIRRLKEETGIVTAVKKIFDFTYQASFENGLTEHEFDHVFAGEYEGSIHLNQEEASDYRYETMDHISEELLQYPNHFTAWFRLAFPQIKNWWQHHYSIQTFKK